MEHLFTFPTREQKKSHVFYTDDKHLTLTIYKSVEYSEVQALILYLFCCDDVKVFLPKSFIEDVEKKNRKLVIKRELFQVIWTCNGNGGGKLHLPKGFWDCIKDWKDKCRFIVFSMHFWSCPRKDGGHANLLIYDCRKSSFERFEPNGSCAIRESWYDSIHFDSAMKQILEKANIGYVVPKYPEKGLQRLQIEENRKNKDILPQYEFMLYNGFCVVWNMVFLAIKIDKDKDSVVCVNEIITSLDGKSYIEFIKTITDRFIVRCVNLFL